MASTRRPYAPRLPPEARRQQLLDAALQVIARDGYAGVSIDAIAREAQVTRPVVYGVFDGLGPLLGALLDRQGERVMAQLMAALPAQPGDVDPEEFMLTAVRRLAETVVGDPLTWRPVLLAPEGTPIVVRQRIAHDRELVRQRVQSLLELALPPKRLARTDTEITAHALIAVAEHFGRLLVEDPARFDIDRLVGSAETLIAAMRR